MCWVLKLYGYDRQKIYLLVVEADKRAEEEKRQPQEEECQYCEEEMLELAQRKLVAEEL